MSRGLRGCVEYGSIEYSAVSQPPVTPCSFIQRGTASSTVTAQITRVLPIETSTEPLACGATFNSKLSGRLSSGPRPSFRCICEKLRWSWGLCYEGFWEHLGFVAVNDELLNELGGAWDLPPKADEDFTDPRLDPLRMKARLLIEGFDLASVWGWKDPRNSLTLPFWQNLLPGLKTLIMVRNPLEVAYSMRERNGTSYSFGLRLWEIYNRRLIEAATGQQQLVTHYDLFFEDAES